LTVTG